MSKELGTLIIVVLKARNLPDKHSFYKQDVFAQVTLQGVTKKTKVEVKGGQHPVWDEELRFPVTEQTAKNGMMLEVSCWSKEPRSDDVVGKGELDITETLRTGEFDDWVPLGINSVMRGDLYLEMTFYAAGPPPALSRRPSKMLPSDRLARPTSLSAPTSNQGSPSPGLSRPASVADSHLKPQAGAPHRLSPRLQEAALPALPEESPENLPPPAALPAILRPGGGKPRPQHKQSNPSVSSINSITSENGANPQPSRSESYQHSPPPVRNSDPIQPPAFLRPGGGISPRHSPTPTPQPSTHVPESQIPNLTSAAIGNTPSATPAPAASTSHQPHRYSLSQEPAYYGPPHASTPAPAPAPTPAHQPQRYNNLYQEPAYYGPPSTHTPANGAGYPPSSHPSVYHPPPPELANDPTPVPALPPQTQITSGYVPPHAWQAPPPNEYPNLQPSTYTAGLGYPSFSFPAPSATPFTPNNGYYPPYNSAPGPRPYPYNYPPPPRDPDFDQPTLVNNPRYAKPLPLPDEPEGGKTPTPAHHQSHTSASTAKHTSHQKTKSRDAHQSAEERDRLAAIKLREEEDERRRIAREQEEHDLELARKLDMELNLTEDGEDSATQQQAAPANGSRTNNNDMPGSWYRHHPGS